MSATETVPMSNGTPDTPETPVKASGYLTAEQLLENAPGDLTERDVDDVFGGRVRVRALTAAQSAQVKQASLQLGGKRPDIVWAEMERLQFRYGVVEPKLNADQVKMLHLTAGASFGKVIAVIDEISGMNKEELRQAQETFPGSVE